MFKFKFLGKVVGYDVKRSLLFFQVPEINEMVIKDIDFLGRDSKLQTLEIKSSKRVDYPSHEMLNKWKSCLYTILESNNLHPYGKNYDDLEDSLIKRYAPLSYVHLKGGELPMLPSIEDIDREHVKIILEKVIDDYTQLGVDFEQYKESMKKKYPNKRRVPV